MLKISASQPSLTADWHLLPDWNRIMNPPPTTQTTADENITRRYSMIMLLTALTAVTILMAMAAAVTVKPKIFPPVAAGVAPPTVTISVEELQRHVDVHTLPVTKTSIEASHRPVRRPEGHEPRR